MDQKQIHDAVTQALEAHIGQKNTAKTKASIEMSLSSVFKKLHEDGVVGAAHKVETRTLWQTMSWKEKALWWLYRRVFKEQARAFREAYYAAWEARVALWAYENKADAIDCPFEIHLPRYLEPYPKSVMVIDAKVKVNQSLDFIEVDFRV